MSIEQDLHRSFRRKPGPADLAERVLARIDGTERRAPAGSGRLERMPPGRYRQGLMRWLAAAAAVTLVATGGARYYTYQQTLAEAERVKQDIRLALQITSEMLALAQQRIARSADDPR
jgi:hypothetical protein